MGRKTFESIGNPLPERFNIIVSESKTYNADNMCSAASFDEAVEKAKKYASQEKCEIFLCGGSKIYSEGIEIADRLYLTELSTDFEGDAYFPDFDKSRYKLIKSDYRENPGLSFNVYERSL